MVLLVLKSLYIVDCSGSPLASNLKFPSNFKFFFLNGFANKIPFLSASMMSKYPHKKEATQDHRPAFHYIRTQIYH